MRVVLDVLKALIFVRWAPPLYVASFVCLSVLENFRRRRMLLYNIARLHMITHMFNINQRRPPFLKTIKRNSDILQSIQLPVVINLNPRSIYNKTDEFSQMLEQYSPELITISESWERENLTLEELLKLENKLELSWAKLS